MAMENTPEARRTSNLLDNFSESASSMLSAAEEASSGALDVMKMAASEVNVPVITDRASSMLSAAEEAGNGALGAMASAANDVQIRSLPGSASSMLSAAEEASKRALGEVASAATDVERTTKQTVLSAAAEVQSGAAGAVGAMGMTTSSVLSAAGGAGTGVLSVAEEVRSGAQGVAEKASAAALDSVPKMAENASSMLSAAEEASKRALGEMASAAAGAATGLGTQATTLSTEAAQAGAAAFNDPVKAAAQVGGDLDGLRRDALTTGAAALSDAGRAVGGAAGAAKDAGAKLLASKLSMDALTSGEAALSEAGEAAFNRTLEQAAAAAAEIAAVGAAAGAAVGAAVDGAASAVAAPPAVVVAAPVAAPLAAPETTETTRHQVVAVVAVDEVEDVDCDEAPLPVKDRAPTVSPMRAPREKGAAEEPVTTPVAAAGAASLGAWGWVEGDTGRGNNPGGGGGGGMVAQQAGMPADVVPTRFVDGCGGDFVEASRRWGITHAWRQDNRVDDYLAHPPGAPHVVKLKKLYKHFFHRRAKNGHVVYYDQITGSAQGEMLKLMSRDELIRYYLYISEYCYLALEPEDPGGRMVQVYDLSQLTMGDCWPSSNAVKLAKDVISACAAHYPERADKVFVINAPGFFTMLWAILSPLLDPRTRAKIAVCGKTDRAEMFEYIDPSCVPVSYGGTDSAAAGESPEEVEMVAYTLKCAALDAADKQGGGGGPFGNGTAHPTFRDPRAILATVRAELAAQGQRKP